MSHITLGDEKRYFSEQKPAATKPFVWPCFYLLCRSACYSTALVIRADFSVWLFSQDIFSLGMNMALKIRL